MGADVTTAVVHPDRNKPASTTKVESIIFSLLSDARAIYPRVSFFRTYMALSGASIILKTVEIDAQQRRLAFIAL